MYYIVASQWYGADKKGPEIGAQLVAELFRKEGSFELNKLQIPDAGYDNDILSLISVLSMMQIVLYPNLFIPH